VGDLGDGGRAGLRVGEAAHVRDENERPRADDNRGVVVICTGGPARPAATAMERGYLDAEILHRGQRETTKERSLGLISGASPRNDEGSKSGAFAPGGEVVLLLRGELVDLHAHGLELELGDLLIEVLGNGVDLILEFLRVLDHVF
jgi:hypothetical protein